MFGEKWMMLFFKQQNLSQIHQLLNPNKPILIKSITAMYPDICPYKVILFLICYSINLLIVKIFKQMGTGDIVLADLGIVTCIHGGEGGCEEI